MNDLETALVAAAKDEAARPAFYEILLRSTVLVVPVGEPPEVVDGVAPRDTTLSLANIPINGQPHIPFFSSEERLTPGTQFLGLAAKVLFEVTRGSHLVLNPGSDYGKVFLPTEVAALLDGSLFEPSQTFTAKAGSKQLIGQPADYPHSMADAVARFLATQPAVEKAFLAQHFIEGVHTKPAILIAVVAPEHGFEKLAGSIGVIAKETHQSEKAVDISRLAPGRLGYFRNLPPIYVREKKGWLGRLFA